MSIDSIIEVIKSEVKIAPFSIPERMSHLRNRLEPYIYNYLSVNHYGMLNEAWASYAPPPNSKHVFAIIERRCHPNFDFVLKNIAWANPDMALYIFCSDENEKFILSLLRDKAANVTIVQAFTGNVSVKEGRDDYNRLLTSPWMYDCFAEDAEYMLTVQMDVFIRRPVRPEIFVGDFWGPPWKWAPGRGGGGGSTIRKISSMREICSEDVIGDPVEEGEDSWMSDMIVKKGYSIPELDFRSMHIMESIYVTNPVVVHQFWSYIDSLIEASHEEAAGFLTRILAFEG